MSGGASPQRIALGDALAHRHILYVLTAGLDCTRTLEPRNEGEWLRVEADAVVSIDVIDAVGRLAQPHLSGIRIADADLFA